MLEWDVAPNKREQINCEYSYMPVRSTHNLQTFCNMEGAGRRNAVDPTDNNKPAQPPKHRNAV